MCKVNNYIIKKGFENNFYINVQKKENKMEQIFDIHLQFYVNTDFTLFGGLFLV